MEEIPVKVIIAIKDGKVDYARGVKVIPLQTEPNEFYENYVDDPDTALPNPKYYLRTLMVSVDYENPDSGRHSTFCPNCKEIKRRKRKRKSLNKKLCRYKSDISPETAIDPCSCNSKDCPYFFKRQRRVL